MPEILPLRRRFSKRRPTDPPDDELLVDPALVKIARRQREAASLKMLETIARELPRVVAALDQFTPTLRRHRGA